MTIFPPAGGKIQPRGRPRAMSSRVAWAWGGLGLGCCLGSALRGPGGARFFFLWGREGRRVFFRSGVTIFPPAGGKIQPRGRPGAMSSRVGWSCALLVSVCRWRARAHRQCMSSGALSEWMPNKPPTAHHLSTIRPMLGARHPLGGPRTHTGDTWATHRRHTGDTHEVQARRHRRSKR